MDVAGRGNVGDFGFGRFSNIIVYVNEGLIRPAKVAVIARGHLTLFVFGSVLCFGFPRL